MTTWLAAQGQLQGTGSRTSLAPTPPAPICGDAARHREASLTTIAKVRLQCPQCGREWGDYSTTSTNGFGWRQRSDGFGNGTYHVPETGLRACDCGTLFLSYEHCVGEDKENALPWSRRPDTADLQRALAVGRFESREFELELRVWLYWLANDAPSAAADRDHIVRSQDLPRLLTLVEALERPPLLLVGQLLRDVGRFEDAIELYESLPEHVVGRQQLIDLARDRRQDLVWLLEDPPGQSPG
jgi:hypothetical protein